jgi:hypothetical protein
MPKDDGGTTCPAPTAAHATRHTTTATPWFMWSGQLLRGHALHFQLGYEDRHTGAAGYRKRILSATRAIMVVTVALPRAHIPIRPERFDSNRQARETIEIADASPSIHTTRSTPPAVPTGPSRQLLHGTKAHLPQHAAPSVRSALQGGCPCYTCRLQQTHTCHHTHTPMHSAQCPYTTPMVPKIQSRAHAQCQPSYRTRACEPCTLARCGGRRQ